MVCFAEGVGRIHCFSARQRCWIIIALFLVAPASHRSLPLSLQDFDRRVKVVESQGAKLKLLVKDKDARVKQAAQQTKRLQEYVLQLFVHPGFFSLLILHSIFFCVSHC
jgi:hypothetical protein